MNNPDKDNQTVCNYTGTATTSSMGPMSLSLMVLGNTKNLRDTKYNICPYNFTPQPKNSHSGTAAYTEGLKRLKNFLAGTPINDLETISGKPVTITLPEASKAFLSTLMDEDEGKKRPHIQLSFKSWSKGTKEGEIMCTYNDAIEGYGRIPGDLIVSVTSK